MTKGKISYKEQRYLKPHKTISDTQPTSKEAPPYNQDLQRDTNAIFETMTGSNVI